MHLAAHRFKPEKNRNHETKNYFIYYRMYRDLLRNHNAFYEHVRYFWLV